MGAGPTRMQNNEPRRLSAPTTNVKMIDAAAVSRNRREIERNKAMQNDRLGRIRTAQITTIGASIVALMRGWPSYLRANGFSVETISAEDRALEDFARHEGIDRVHVVPMTRRITPWTDLKCVWRISRILRAGRYDVVHASTPKGGLLGMIAATLARTPVRIFTLRGLPIVVSRGWKRRLLWICDWLTFRLAHRVTAISASVAQEAVSLGLCPADKITVIGHGSSNGIDAARYTRHGPSSSAVLRAKWNIPPQAVVVGFVGRIVHDKGVIELEQAWQTVRTAEPQARLVIVGTPNDEDPVPPDVMQRLQRDERVVLAGWMDNPAAAYEAMDILVLPTHREGFGNVLLEANSMELPVIASRVTGCVDAVVDGVTGLLFPARDAAALAQAILTLVRDPQLRRSMGQAGRERVLRDFRSETIWAGMLQLYHEELRRAGRMPRAAAAVDNTSGVA